MVCVSHKQLIMRRFFNGTSVYEALLMGRDENDADAWCKAMLLAWSWLDRGLAVTMQPNPSPASSPRELEKPSRNLC